MHKTPRINPDFESLIPPLTTDEFNQLEQNILAHGCRDPIALWRDIVVDGHNRLEICTKHGIEYETVKLRFPSKEAVKIWMLENQLGRRNLTDAMRIELAARKVEYMGHRTNETIAREAKLSEKTVQRYMQIKTRGGPELLEKVMTGDLKIGTAHQRVVVTSITREQIETDEPTPEERNFNISRAIMSNIGQIENIYKFLILHRINYVDMPKGAASRLNSQYKRLRRLEGGG